MSEWTLAEVVDLAGGAATPESSGGLVAAGELEAAARSLQWASLRFEEVAGRAGRPVSWAIVLTASPSFACAVRAVEGGFAVLVPAGVLARVRTMARLLLAWWGQPSPVQVFRSPQDAIDDPEERFPPLLRPLFAESDSATGLAAGLKALEATVEPDPRFDNDVAELSHLALLYLVSHEFAHVLNGHFEALDEAASADPDARARLERGVELDADDTAAALSLLIMQQNLEVARQMGQTDRMETGLLRLGYAVTLLFGMFDATRKHFPAYGAGAYNHPLVRCEMFFGAVERAVQGEPAEKLAFMDPVTQGWKQCVDAYERLNLEAMKGRYGVPSDGRPSGPLHALTYGVTAMGPTNRALMAETEAAMRLLFEVRQSLPIYRRPG